MSEQGWQTFLAAGLDDWVVLHGGAAAVYVVRSLPEAAALAAAFAVVPGLEASGALLTLGPERVTVRLARGVFKLEPEHVEVARAVSRVAREHGAAADRSQVQEVQVAVSAKPDEVDLGFWSAVLGYDAIDADQGVDPLGVGSVFWTQELDAAKPLRHAMHVDVSLAREQAEARLAAALAAGGRVVADEMAPEFWIVADRAGNKVCICAWPDGATRPDSRDSRDS